MIRYVIAAMCWIQMGVVFAQPTSSAIALGDALNQLSQRFGVKFSYSDQLIDKRTTNLIVMKDLDLTLKTILHTNQIDFKVVGDQVALFPLQIYRASGLVLDADSGQPLIGAHIYNKETHRGIPTDIQGYFSLETTRIDSSFLVSYLGYETQSVNLRRHGPQNIYLQPSNDLPAILVLGKDFDYVSKYTLQQDELQIINSKLFEQIPALGAEPDVLQFASQLPGVHLSNDGVSGLRVRGGSTDQNLISMDRVPIYYPFHVLGYKSIFDASDISHVLFEKSGFDASENGRLSSYFSMYSEDPNNQKVEGNVAVGTFFGKASLSLPLIKDKLAVQVAYKKSFAQNWISKLSEIYLDRSDIKGFNTFSFRDFRVKMVYNSANRKHQITSRLYSGTDLFQDEKLYQSFWDDETFDRDENSGNSIYGNQVGYLQWIYRPNDRWNSSTQCYYSGYRYRSSFGNLYQYNSTVDEESYAWSSAQAFASELMDVGLRHEWIYRNRNVTLKLGGTISQQTYHTGLSYEFDEAPDTQISNQLKLPELPQDLTTDVAHFGTSYLQLNQSMADWDFKLGLAISIYQSNEYRVAHLLPRVAINRLIGNNLSVFLHYDRAVQNQHVLSLTAAGQPNEIWVPANANAPSQSAGQVSLGFKKRVRNTYIRMEGYYKKLEGIIDISDQAIVLNEATLENIDPAFWNEFVDFGSSQNYGVECNVQQNWDPFYLQTNYTLSRAIRQFDEKYFGEKVSYEYNPVHQLSIQTIYRPSTHFSVGMSWVFASKVPLTLIEGSYDLLEGNTYSEQIDVGPETIESWSLPTFHRLNISANINLPSKKNLHSLKLAISNVYNQFNYTHYKIFNQRDAIDYFATIRLYQSLPFLPSIYYKVEF